MNRPSPITRESHGGDVGRGLAIEGDRQWRQAQQEGRVHSDECHRGGECPRCERESALRQRELREGRP